MENETKKTSFDDIATREKFKLWLATPSWERTPKTQQELAQVLQVHPVTLSKWKDRKFIEEVIFLVQSEARKYTVDIIHSIAQKASQGSVPHARLYLEYIEKWSPRFIYPTDPRVEEQIEETGKIIEEMRQIAQSAKELDNSETNANQISN